MNNRLQKQPVVTYTVGQPALPAKPPFCYQRRVSSSGSAGANTVGSTSVTVTSSDSSQVSTSGSDGSIVFVNHGYGGTPSRPKPTYVTVCYGGYPAQEGIPARIDYQAMNGWNGGARSIKPVPVGSYFDVSVPDDAVGVMLGLSDGQFDHSYSHASHAMVVRPTGITPVERGVDVGGAVALGTRLRMIRDPGGVRMFVDGELIHTSSTKVTGDAYLDATLYAMSDYAFDPVIGRIYEISASASLGVAALVSIRPRGVAKVGVSAAARVMVNGTYRSVGLARIGISTVVTAAANVRSYGLSQAGATYVANGFTARKGLSVSGVASSYCIAQIGIAAGGTDSIVAIGSVTSKIGLTLSAQGGTPEAEINQFACNLPAPQLTALGVVVTEGTMNADFGVIAIGSDADIAGVDSSAAIGYFTTAWQPYLPEDVADIGEPIYASDSMYLDTIVLIAMMEQLGVSDELDIYLIVDVSLYDSMMVGDNLSLANVIELVMREQVSVNSKIGQVKTQALQYAVNAVTGALSTYRNFGFKQFATVDGVTYGITDTGLYRLQGDSDDGDPLSAVIDFGATDFGTARAKRLSYVYAGLATDGEVYIRLTGDDGEERVYKAIGSGPERRAQTALGLAARHWRLRLELVDATYGDLDNTEIVLGVSQRRLIGK